VRAAEFLAADFTEPVRSFIEKGGCGIEGVVDGHEMMLGSSAWFESRGVAVRGRASLSSSARRAANSITHDVVKIPPRCAGDSETLPSGALVNVAIDGEYRGCFVLESALRNRVAEAVRALSLNYELTLLSGDNERQKDTFAELFGERTRFNQSPLDKLEFIHALQRSGKTVMMVGDGLNDAGALKQSDVGVAVVENIAAFSPASDVIMSAGMVSQLDAMLTFSKRAARVVRLSFFLSSLYNVIGVSIAASGLLAPIVCAILMPISSISVVAFACGATAWAARKSFPQRAKLGASAAIGGERDTALSSILEPLT
jgi:cation transport ATPase